MMHLYEMISTAYKETTANFFAVTGNIHDIELYTDEGAKERKTAQTKELLIRKLESVNHVVYFSPSAGMRYTKAEHQNEFYALDATLKEVHSRAFALDYAQTKYDVLSGLHIIKTLLASYRKMREHYGAGRVKNLVVLIDDADLVFANKPLEHMGNDEKLTLSLAREMFESSDFMSSSDAVILLSAGFLSLHEGVRHIGGLYPLVVPLPDEALRHAFISYQNALYGHALAADKIDEIASLSAGITLSTLRVILKQEPERIVERIRDEVASIIEKSLGGHVQVLRPAYGFDHVIGYDALKLRARKLIGRMEGKHPWRSLAYVGATGTGKDFQTEAFLYEAGLPVMKLGTIKSKWYGETAVIIEKIKMVARSFSKIAIFKPEADKLFPDPEADDAHQTDQELSAIFLDWMADPKDRGRIFWVFNTSRPQMFPVDFQRRVEIKLPIFDLEGEERALFIRLMFERKNIPVSADESESFYARLGAMCEGFSSDQIRMLADEVAAELSVSPQSDIIEIVEDLNINVVREERMRQARHAAAFSTYKSLIPDFWRHDLPQ